MKKTVTPYLLLLLATMTLVACQDDLPYEGPGQSDRELMQLMKLASPNGTLEYYLLPSSSDYASIPQDPRNPITPAKVELGKLLFHETCISVDGKGASQNFQTWSCASCHHVDAGFQAGVRQGIAEGGMGFGFQGEGRHPIPGYPDTAYDVQPVKSPSILNIAYQEVVLWNGQFGATGPNAGTEAQWTPGSPKEVNHLGYQGVESQAIGAMTVHRLRIDTQMFQQLPEYQYLFNAAFSNLPPEERVTKITAGLAIAAYERTVLANESPFQKWLRGDYSAMNEDQKKGALLFFGKAECSTCHTGPALNSMEFYAFGMKDLLGPDIINADPYDGAHMGRGGFTGKFEDRYKFKVPQIYNLREALFYGHGSTFTSIEDVVKYKNEAIKANPNVPDSQLSEHFKPLGLSHEEIQLLTEFLYTALHDDNLRRYVPSELPSGFCFPNNDIESRTDLGCN